MNEWWMTGQTATFFVTSSCWQILHQLQRDEDSGAGGDGMISQKQRLVHQTNAGDECKQLVQKCWIKRVECNRHPMLSGGHFLVLNFQATQIENKVHTFHPCKIWRRAALQSEILEFRRREREARKGNSTI